MSRNGRVQVNDLAAPEAIKPYGFQSDTYARPPEPVLNNDLENLQRALGAFGAGFEALHARQKRDAEKAAKEAMERKDEQVKADLAEWRIATNSPDRLRAWYDGTAPYQQDPIYGKFSRKMWANDQAEAFAAEVAEDPELAKGLGSEDFDVDGYLRNRAAPHLQHMQGEDDLMITFGAGYEKTRDEIMRAHQAKRGQNRVMDAKEKVYDQLSRAFDDGAINKQLRGQPLHDEYRRMHKVFGPRDGVRKGVTDLPDEVIDDLTLQMLEEKADNAQAAEAVMDMLDTPRQSMDDESVQLPAFSATFKHKEAVDRIREKARKTLEAEVERQATEAVLQEDRKKFAAMDGSFNALTDYEEINPWNPNKPIKITGKQRRDAAAQAWLDNQRERYGVNPEREIEFFQRNSTPHPEFIPLLEAGFTGLGNIPVTGQKGVPPDAVGKVVEMGTLYLNSTKNGYAHINKNLSEGARNFYELYRMNMRYRKMTAEEAALDVIRIHSTVGGDADPHIVSQKGADISAALNRVGQSVWQGNVANSQDLFFEAEQLAKLYSLSSGLNAGDAVKAAIERIEEDRVMLNGRAVYGIQGFTKDDVPAANRFFETAFEASPGIMKRYGIDDPTDLSLAPLAEGSFVLVRASDGHVILDERMRGVTPNVEMIQSYRKVIETENAQAGAEVAKANRDEARSIWEANNPGKRRPAAAPIINTPGDTFVKERAENVVKGAKLVNQLGNAARDKALDAIGSVTVEPFRRVFGDDGLWKDKTQK